jgi:phosphate transport system substrate-binding protein
MQRQLIVFIVICVAVLLLSSCGPTGTQPVSVSDSTYRGHITFAGSTTVQPLAHKLGEVFQKAHPDVELDIAAGGSVVGIQAIHDGTVDIGMASRALRPDEQEGIEQHQVAADVIAVVVHTSNPVESLTMNQLRSIYMGEIVNWRAVGGPDLPIVVVAREKTSGTRGAFDEIVLDGEDPAAPSLQKAIAASDVAAMVSDGPDMIGYVGFGHLSEGLKLIAIEGVFPSEDTARSGAYELLRPLLFITGPLTQPLARDFVAFALSDAGQQVVASEGWVQAH